MDGLIREAATGSEINNMHVDLLFSVQGSTIPRNHGYSLYSAVSHVVAAVHGAKDIGIFSIRGTPDGGTALLLHQGSHLRIRVPAEKLPLLLPLAGQTLELNGHKIRLGVPSVAALVPAPAVSSPLVLIKLANEKVQPVTPAEGTAVATKPNIVTPEAFLASAQKQLTNMGIGGVPCIQQVRTGPRAGQPRRRVLRVKSQTHVGYAMVIHSLTAEESIRLQEEGLGGRRLMGCGNFLPERGR